nr:hypothetical protein CFP56_06630 [Quercus suber]
MEQQKEQQDASDKHQPESSESKVTENKGEPKQGQQKEQQDASDKHQPESSESKVTENKGEPKQGDNLVHEHERTLTEKCLEFLCCCCFRKESFIPK